MRKNDKLSTGQKIAACTFALILIAAACMVGLRIAQKPAYEAHEQLQCDLLAVSLLETLAEITKTHPEIWVQFDPATTLMIDHRRMPGAWNVLFEARTDSGYVNVEALAASGWNSRSPKETRFSASISLQDGTIAYMEEGAAKLAHGLPGQKIEAKKKILPLMFRDEKEPGTPMHVCVSEVQVEGGKAPYLVIFPEN